VRYMGDRHGVRCAARGGPTIAGDTELEAERRRQSARMALNVGPLRRMHASAYVGRPIHRSTHPPIHPCTDMALDLAIASTQACVIGTGNPTKGTKNRCMGTDNCSKGTKNLSMGTDNHGKGTGEPLHKACVGATSSRTGAAQDGRFLSARTLRAAGKRLLLPRSMVIYGTPWYSLLAKCCISTHKHRARAYPPSSPRALPSLHRTSRIRWYERVRALR
jgi:hypothetical protein